MEPDFTLEIPCAFPGNWRAKDIMKLVQHLQETYEQVRVHFENPNTAQSLKGQKGRLVLSCYHTIQKHGVIR